MEYYTIIKNSIAVGCYLRQPAIRGLPCANFMLRTGESGNAAIIWSWHSCSVNQTAATSVLLGRNSNPPSLGYRIVRPGGRGMVTE